MHPLTRCLLVGAGASALSSSGVVASAVRGTPVCDDETIVVHDDLSSDFSLTQNPNVRWSYDQAGSPIAAQLAGFITELRGWGASPSYDSSITQFVSNPSSGWHDAQLHDVVIHVSSSGFAGPMSVSWRAPRAGIVTVTGRAWDASFAADRDANWTLTLNGATIAERNTIRGTFRSDAAATFANNLLPGQSLADIPVAAGDVLRFTTNRLTFFGHFMGVSMSIDLTTTRCAGDIDADFGVGLGDVAAIITCWSMPASCNLCADLDGSGDIGLGDMSEVILHWGDVCP